MAIKIPGAAEVGLGRKTPGAIAEGTPRPIPKIRGDVTYEVLQGLTRLGSAVAFEQKVKREKREKVAHDEALSRAKITNIGLQGQIVSGSTEIANREDLDVEGKEREFASLMENVEGEFNTTIPPDFRAELEPHLALTGKNTRLKFDDQIAAQVKNKRIADLETSLSEVETFSSENPGYEQDIKKQAHILIEASPESATEKVARKEKIDAVIDGNTVKNELALGDPKTLLDSLQEKTEGGAYKNYRGLSSANRTLYTKQARDAVAVNNGLKIANDLWEGKDGPKDKFDLVDIEDLVETARKRAGTEQAAAAAVTRIRERTALHNQARNAKIKSNKLTIWEAYDEGVKSAGIEKMEEFVELPVDERMSIRKTIAEIAKAANKKDTPKLRAGQRARFNELSTDPALLRGLGNAGLIEEERTRQITSSEYNTLKGMLDKGSLEAAQSKKAFGLIKTAEKTEIFDSSDTFENARQAAASEEELHDFILMNPDGDSIAYVEEMLKPKESNFIKNLLDSFSLENLARFGLAPGRRDLPGFLRSAKELDKATAIKYIELAGGDKDKARELAREDGFEF